MSNKQALQPWVSSKLKPYWWCHKGVMHDGIIYIRLIGQLAKRLYDTPKFHYVFTHHLSAYQQLLGARLIDVLPYQDGDVNSLSLCQQFRINRATLTILLNNVLIYKQDKCCASRGIQTLAYVHNHLTQSTPILKTDQYTQLCLCDDCRAFVEMPF